MGGTSNSLHRRALLRGAGSLALAGSIAAPPLAGLAAPALASDRGGLEALGRDMNGRLILPEDEAFGLSAQPNNARWAFVTPAAVAMCADATDVQRCLRFVRDTGMPFAVRSGGHNYAGFSTTPGLLISVRALDEAKLDLRNGTVTVSAGVNNQDMATALRGTSFGVPTGRCPTVGASGLVLGGGWGFSATRSGLTCDSLLSTEVVLADGTRQVLDATRNADLFWAVRGGGGGNFGVHTNFTFKLHEVGDVTTFNIVWPAGRQVELMTALQGIQHDHSRRISTRTKARPLTAAAHPGRDRIVVETLGLFWGSERDFRDVMQPAFRVAAPDVATIYEQEYWRARDYLLTDDPNGLYEIRCNYVADRLREDALDTMLDWMGRWPGGSVRPDNMGILFAMGGAVGDIAADATAYPHRQSSAIFEMEANWGPLDRPDTVKRQRDWLAAYHADMQRFLLPRSYVNFPNRDLTDWARAYYGDNLVRLSAIKRKYDPDNLFRFAQSIPLVAA